MKITKLQYAYLLLSLAGLIGTWFFNIRFMQETGWLFDVGAFVKGGYANDASSSLTNDVTVGAFAFFLWSFFEARRLGMKNWWAYFALTWGIAFAFAFPLFLFMRERKLAER